MVCYQLEWSPREKLQEIFYPDTCFLFLFLTFDDRLSSGVCRTVMPCPEQRTPILKPQEIDTMLGKRTQCCIDEWNLRLPWEHRHPSCYYKKGHSGCSHETAYILLILCGIKKKKVPTGKCCIFLKNLIKNVKLPVSALIKSSKSNFKMLLDFTGTKAAPIHLSSYLLPWCSQDNCCKTKYELFPSAGVLIKHIICTDGLRREFLCPVGPVKVT